MVGWKSAEATEGAGAQARADALHQVVVGVGECRGDVRQPDARVLACFFTAQLLLPSNATCGKQDAARAAKTPPEGERGGVGVVVVCVRTPRGRARGCGACRAATAAPLSDNGRRLPSVGVRAPARAPAFGWPRPRRSLDPRHARRAGAWWASRPRRRARRRARRPRCWRARARSSARSRAASSALGARRRRPSAPSAAAEEVRATPQAARGAHAEAPRWQPAKAPPLKKMRALPVALAPQRGE